MKIKSFGTPVIRVVMAVTLVVSANNMPRFLEDNKTVVGLPQIPKVLVYYEDLETAAKVSRQRCLKWVSRSDDPLIARAIERSRYGRICVKRGGMG